MGVEALHQRLNSGAQRLRCVLASRSAALGQHVEMVALCRAETERVGESVEYLAGGPDVAALLQERVVGVRDAGELGNLLPPQSGDPAARAVGEPDVGGPEAGAPGTEEGAAIPTGPHRCCAARPRPRLT